MKICKKCNESKDLSNFYKDPGSKDKLKYICISCYSIESSEWGKNNKEKKAKITEEWRKRNPEKYKEQKKKYRENNLEKIKDSLIK